MSPFAYFCLQILYYSSILGGKHDGPECRRLTSYNHTSLSLLSESIVKDPESAVSLDPLEQELGVRPVDARKPLIPFNEFYNEPLSEEFRMFLASKLFFFQFQASFRLTNVILNFRMVILEASA